MTLIHFVHLRFAESGIKQCKTSEALHCCNICFFNGMEWSDDGEGDIVIQFADFFEGMDEFKAAFHVENSREKKFYVAAVFFGGDAFFFFDEWIDYC